MIPRGATLIRRAAIEEAGPGFLEPGLAGEYPELDFFARVLRKGWDLVYLASLAAWRGRPVSDSGRADGTLAASRRRFLFRHGEEAALKGLPRRAPDRSRGEEDRAALLEQRRRLRATELLPYAAAVIALQSDPGLPAAGNPDADQALVSIVIANYNYGRYLAEAIESALGQTHPAVEVIVVDDGSVDDSRAVAARYPVKLLEQPNQGVAAARNRGAAEARGEFLVFLDADDRLEPSYIERCLGRLLGCGDPVGYVYTWMRHFGADRRIYVSRPFTPEALLAGSFVHASALMRRSAFEATGGFDPAWRLGHEDYELWVRMLHCGIHGVLLPEPLLCYRRHEGGRNALPRPRLRELRWRMRLTYPGFYWRKLLQDPFRTLFYLWRFRGFPKRRRPGVTGADPGNSR